MSYVIKLSLILLSVMSTLNQCCQLSSGEVLKNASRCSRESLLMIGRAARAVSRASLDYGRRLASGMLHHPRVSCVCIGGLLIAMPRVRSAIARVSSRGAGMLSSTIVGRMARRIHTFFFGEITDSLNRAHVVLDDHTGRLSSIQKGVHTLHKQVRSVEGQIQNVSVDVADVKVRVNESYGLLQNLQQGGHAHGQELHAVHQECDEINRIVAGFTAQLEAIRAAIAEHETASDRRNQQCIDMIQRYMRENGAALHLLQQQLTGKLEQIEKKEDQRYTEFQQKLDLLLMSLGQLLTQFPGKNDSEKSKKRVSKKGQPEERAQCKACTS